LDGLDRRLSALGTSGAAIVLTLLAIGGTFALHMLLCLVEDQTVEPLSLFNIAVQTALIALPLVLYARLVIARLNRSKSHLDEMTRRLAVAAEQAHQANRAKSAFLANMSHELRTPLNAILGFSEVMKDQHLGPVHNARYLGYAADIHASGRYLLGIINDILDLSKIEAGKMSLENAEEFALASVIEASVGMVAALAEKFDVALTAEMPAAEIRLLAVERMVRQILINLVGNAIKFTQAGGTVRIGGAASPDGGYLVTVEDSGVGMREDEIAEALMPFHQIENRMSAKHTGTGLGLPLAKAMMELHGGALAIESRPGKGTCITLIFPAARIARACKSAA
jgi:signal transduction histidine kinase